MKIINIALICIGMSLIAHEDATIKSPRKIEPTRSGLKKIFYGTAIGLLFAYYPGRYSFQNLKNEWHKSKVKISDNGNIDAGKSDFSFQKALVNGVGLGLSISLPGYLLYDGLCDLGALERLKKVATHIKHRLVHEVQNDEK